MICSCLIVLLSIVKKKMKATQNITFAYSLHVLFYPSFLWSFFVFHREGVQWDAIDWMDNAECLDLIEKVLSIYREK